MFLRKLFIQKSQNDAVGDYMLDHHAKLDILFKSDRDVNICLHENLYNAMCH